MTMDLSTTEEESHAADSADGKGDGDGNTNLHDSDFTVDSHTSGPTPGAGWFGGMGTDFLHCLTDNVTPMVSGVATLVQKTAVAVANEISQLEREGELLAAAALQEANGNYSNDDGRATGPTDTCQSSSFNCDVGRKTDLTLPWEVCLESSNSLTLEGEDGKIPVYFTDSELMKKIFAISSDDSTFLGPFSEKTTEVDELTKQPSHWSTFAIDEPRVKLINRILDIDENLVLTHSRLSGDPNYSEIHFWKNYFFHCERVRNDEFCQRKTENETTTTETQPFEKAGATKVDDYLAADAGVNTGTSKYGDEESLVPVGSDTEGEHDDNLSFVIQSAPNTGDTIATSRSIDEDIVLVDTYENLLRIESS